MGRWYPNKKTATEKCFHIDIRHLKKWNFLRKGTTIRSGTIRWIKDDEELGSGNIRFIMGINAYLELDYHLVDPNAKEKNLHTLRVTLSSTPCHFGGVRWWFICPSKDCGRRVAVLYLPNGASCFGCRHCHSLSYESCQAHDKRIDFLVRRPESLKALMGSQSFKRKSIAMKAALKLLAKK